MNDARQRAKIETEDGWLALYLGGMTTVGIAREAKVRRDTVAAGIEAARSRALLGSPEPSKVPPPALRVIFGPSCKAKPTCADIHPRGPIPSGSLDCCFHCHQTGIEDHPALQRA